MSRLILVISAAALICASSQIAFADESGTVTGAVGGAVAGAVVGGAGWRGGGRRRGSRNRKLRDQPQALSSRLRLSPLSPPLRSILTDRRRPVRGRRRGSGFAGSESTSSIRSG